MCLDMSVIYSTVFMPRKHIIRQDIKIFFKNFLLVIFLILFCAFNCLNLLEFILLYEMFEKSILKYITHCVLWAMSYKHLLPYLSVLICKLNMVILSTSQVC